VPIKALNNGILWR